MLNSVIIREMFATDLRRDFWATLSALSPVHMEEDEAYRVYRARLKAKIVTYVALLDQRIVGTASVLIEPKYLHQGGLVGHVEDVAVHPEFRGHGIGQALVRTCLERCREAKCYKVILDCESKNVPYYEKLGFKPWCHAMRYDFPAD